MELETLAAPDVEPAQTEPSLADHEAEFSKQARGGARQTADEPSPESGAAALDGEGSAAGERDTAGRFKKVSPSHKARASDVETIAALTKEYHEALAETGLELEQEPGESNRVFALRKNAAIAKALRDAKRAPVVQAISRVVPYLQPIPGVTDQPDLKSEPKQADYDDYTEYVRAIARWEAKATYDRARQADEQQRQSDAFASGVRTRFTDARTRYPDFKAVVEDPATSPIPRGSTIELFTLKHKFGPDVVYHLFKHPDEVAAIAALPDRDDQIAELTLLGQRLTASSTRAGVPTRSSAVSAPTPVVKPPNLVRTGAIRAGDELPGEDASLAEHEKAFYAKRRR